MNKDILVSTVARLVMPPKGILAIDESVHTCNARFEKLGIEQSQEKRREYRQLLVTAPDIENYISGFITFDETIRQATKEGKAFTTILKEKGIDIGIKVDEGLVDFPPITGEKLTKGLVGLDERLKEYRAMGASFAKWRTEFVISDETPSEALMHENAKALALYAQACHTEDIVPIVEPEIMITGDHSIDKCYEVTAKNLDILFAELKNLDIFIPGIILKTSMVTSGKDATEKAGAEKIAEMTLKCLKEHVPADIGGIVFLSGGLSEEESIVDLNTMHLFKTLPWSLTFSYGRAIQNSALEHWAAHPEDIAGAQKLLLEAAHKNSLASIGEYK